MSKRYTVTSVPTTSGPEYVIHDNLTDTDIGFFDTQKWAESWAAVFEERWEKRPFEKCKRKINTKK